MVTITSLHLTEARSNWSDIFILAYPYSSWDIWDIQGPENEPRIQMTQLRKCIQKDRIYKKSKLDTHSQDSFLKI